MTNENTGLELARYYLEEGRIATAVRQILAHLEAQVAGPSEDNVERHESLTLADLYEVVGKVSEDVFVLRRELMETMVRVQRLEPPVDPTGASEVMAYPALPGTSLDDVCAHLECGLRRREHTNAMHHFVDLAPPAVQGEERALLELALELADQIGDPSWRVEMRARGISAGDQAANMLAAWAIATRASLAASSPAVPTESAEVPVDWNYDPHDLTRDLCDFAYMNHGRCTLVKGHPAALHHVAEDGFQWRSIPDPLPAQTEGGERDANQRMTETERARLREQARYALPPQPATTPPPATECAHETPILRISNALRSFSDNRLNAVMVTCACGWSTGWLEVQP